MKLFLGLLGLMSLGIAAIAAGAMKSDIQFILLMLGVIGGILGLGLTAVIERLETLAAAVTKAGHGQQPTVPPPLAGGGGTETTRGRWS